MKYSIISSYHSFSRIVEQTLRFDHYFVHQSSSNFSIYYQFRKILQQKDENLENPETPCVLNVSSSPRLHFINVLAFSSSIRRLLQFSILSFIFQTSFTISLSAQNLFDDKKTLEKAAGNAGLTIHVRMADDPSQYPLNWSAILQDSQTGTNLDTAYVANSDSVHWPNLPTDIKDYDGIPLKFWLGQSYPNPFNPSAKIPFSLDKESKAQMNIYNVNGELVKKLFDGHEKAGKYEAEWAGDNDDGKTVAAGVYFYQLITDDGILVGKMANLGGYGKSPSNLSAGQFDESKAQNNGKAVKKGQFGEQGYKVEIRAHEDSTHPYFENQLVTLNNLASDSIIYLALSRVIKPIKLDSIENFSFLEDSLPRDSTIGKIKARGYDPNGYATTLQFSLSQTNPELLRVFLDSAAIKADSLKKDGNGQVEITYRAATPWTNAERKFNVKVLPLADIIIDAFANGKPVGYYKVDVKDSVGNVFYTQSTGSSNHVELSNMEKPVSSLEILLTDSSKMYFPPNVINFSPPFTGDTSLVVDLFNQVPVNIDVTSLVQMLSGNVPGKYEIVQLKQNGNVLQEKNTGEAGNVMFADVARNKNYTISVLGDTASRPNINAKDTLLFIDKDTAIVVNPGLYLRAAALNSLENKTFNEDEFPANPILHDLWTKATGYDSLGNQAGANAFQYLVLSQTNPNLAPVIIQANQYTKLDSLLSDGNGPNNVTVKAVAPNNMSDQKGFSVTVSPKTDRKGQLKDVYGIPREGYIFARNNQGQQFIMQTDAQGRFTYQMNNGISWDSLKAQIKNDVRPSEGGFIRAMYFQNPSDLNDINVVAVPHLAGADYIGLDTLDSFIKEANFNHPVGNNVGKLKKADLNNLLDFISSTYSGLGTITLPEQDYIINNIGQRIDPYFNIPSAKWKVPQDSVMTSPKDNAINWFKDPNGALGSISTRDADGDGILERANIRLLYIIKVTGQDTIRNNLGIVQEGLSARVAPGEVGLTSTIPASKTVLHAGTGAPGLMLQPADIWLVKICESYPALTPHGDILKKGNYQQEFDEQIGSNSGP